MTGAWKLTCPPAGVTGLAPAVEPPDVTAPGPGPLAQYHRVHALEEHAVR